jgi:hypothetical protein
MVSQWYELTPFLEDRGADEAHEPFDEAPVPFAARRLGQSSGPSTEKSARRLERGGQHPRALGDGIGVTRYAGLERQLQPVLVLFAIARDHV